MCDVFKPAFDRVAEKNKDTMIFAAANLEKSELAFLKKGIQGYPTTAVFKPGQKKPILKAGALSEDFLEGWLKKQQS
jgi:thiol-disulfide isomerase/thioredoxin